MSSAPLRIAENWALVLISEEFGINLGRDLAAAALGDFRGEHPAQPVAEIALVDGAAGKLVRDLQRGCGVRRTDAEAQDRRRGKRRARAWRRVSMDFSPESFFLIGCRARH